MKLHRFLFFVFMLSLLTSIPLSNAVAASAALSPIANKNLSGGSVGSLSALDTIDHTTFMEFKTPGKVYKGFRTYKLPASMPRESVSSLKVKVSYRGLPAGSQTWTWYAYNWSAQSWTKIGTNQGAKNNVWKTFVFKVPNPQAHVQGTGAVRILLQSNNASGDAKIDYEGVLVTTAYVLGNAPNIPAKCAVFPANNYWNTPVNTLNVDPRSAAWINSIGADRHFHMDFGSGLWDGGPIGIPYNVVSGSAVTKYDVDFYYPAQSDPGPYPIPNSPAREWGSDHHILVVDTDTCILYETYDMSFSGGQWSGGSGAIWDMGSNALRPDVWTSADAAGLPILAGLARYQEIEAALQQPNPSDQIIPHALRFTVNCSPDWYIWPARHQARSGSCANPVPFGARFRLKANYNISGFDPVLQVILRTMKVYGIVNADNGGPWVINGVPDERWDNVMLHELDVLTGSNFEAVNTACMKVGINSGQANLANCP